MMWPFSSSSKTDNSLDSPGCPVDHQSPGRRSSRQDVAMESNNTRLPTDRVISSIPRYRAERTTQEGPSSCPVQHDSAVSADSSTDPTIQQNWVYPSPSQFYNALKRKSRNPRAEDMYTVVPIHNAVNERVWTEVLEWEAYYGRGAFDRWPRSGKSGPMLCSFRGRPDDLSPRAWIKVLSGYQAPFDRHDWEVIRPTEQRMRYVVDFYPGRGADSVPTGADGGRSNGAGGPNLAFYLDVRPALDSWEGVRMRALRAANELLSAFTPSPKPPTSSQPTEKSS